MSDNLKISKTTAYWLIQVCTKMVRDGLGRKNWHPMGTTIDRFAEEGLIDKVLTLNDDSLNSWVESLIMVARLIASSLAFQVEPQLIDNMLDINFDDFDIEE